MVQNALVSGFPDGVNPTAVVRSSSGALFGNTRSGGVNNDGTVFQLTPPVIGKSWSESIIYSFGSGFFDGIYPDAALTLGPNGVLFGTTKEGGAYGHGTIFELTPPVDGGDWSESVIYDFTGSYDPVASLTLTASGALLGIVSGDGDLSVAQSPEHGSARYEPPSSAFALIPPAVQGGQWTETILAVFGISSAASPLLVGGKALFGTLIDSGTNLAGVVYELTPPAMQGSQWTVNVLYNFPASNGGPSGNLVFGAHQILFGTTSGTLNEPQSGSVFSLTPPAQPGGNWTFTLIHSLDPSIDGAKPSGGLSEDKQGTLFGFAYSGGASNDGTVFAVIPAQ